MHQRLVKGYFCIKRNVCIIGYSISTTTASFCYAKSLYQEGTRHAFSLTTAIGSDSPLTQLVFLTSQLRIRGAVHTVPLVILCIYCTLWTDNYDLNVNSPKLHFNQWAWVVCYCYIWHPKFIMIWYLQDESSFLLLFRIALTGSSEVF